MRRVTRNTRTTVISLLAACLFVGTAASSCEEDEDKPTSRTSESRSRNTNYDELVKRQPAETGGYSPTRETKNFWIRTWMKTPNKLSYVYIQNANGKYGYFIFKGLPVTYCVSLLPPEIKAKVESGNYMDDVMVQAPSMDGTYSSNSNCSSYYGIDATTGAYVEFAISANQSYILFDKPMDLPLFKDAEPMGPSTIEAVKKLN